jgi:hypothetical protein
MYPQERTETAPGSKMGRSWSTPLCRERLGASRWPDADSWSAVDANTDGKPRPAREPVDQLGSSEDVGRGRRKSLVPPLLGQQATRNRAKARSKRPDGHPQAVGNNPPTNGAFPTHRHPRFWRTLSGDRSGLPHARGSSGHDKRFRSSIPSSFSPSRLVGCGSEDDLVSFRGGFDLQFKAVRAPRSRTKVTRYAQIAGDGGQGALFENLGFLFPRYAEEDPFRQGLTYA